MRHKRTLYDIKESIHQGDLTITNMYTPKEPTYKKNPQNLHIEEQIR